MTDAKGLDDEARPISDFGEARACQARLSNLDHRAVRCDRSRHRPDAGLSQFSRITAVTDAAASQFIGKVAELSADRIGSQLKLVRDNSTY